MRRTAFLAACMVAAGATSVQAEPTSRVISSEDQKLYIKVETDQQTTFTADLKSGQVGYNNGTVRRTYLSRGEIPITTARFYELLEDSNSAPKFMFRIREKHATERLWGWSALGSFGVGAAGLLGSSSLYANRNTRGFSGPLNTVGLIGLGAGVVASCVYLWVGLRPDFTWEEANDAIKDYNRKLP